MIDQILSCLEEHITLSPDQKKQLQERIQNHDHVWLCEHPHTGIMTFEDWMYNTTISSQQVIIGCDHDESTLQRLQSHLQEYMHAHSSITMFNTIVNDNRQDIIHLFSECGFEPWYDYKAMKAVECTATTQHQLRRRNIQPTDFETYITTMGECFVPMRSSVDIQPHNVVDKLWATPELKVQCFNDWMQDQANTYLYFDQDEWVGAGLILDGHDIDDVFVPPYHQGKGYGKAIIIDLMNQILENGKTPTIGFVGINEKAGALYEQCGFKVTRHTHHLRRKI